MSDLRTGRCILGLEPENVTTCFSLSPKAEPEWPASERQVWHALRLLPDPWVLFHSVRWCDGSENGEADFVLLHPHHGLAVLEAKGGGIVVLAPTVTVEPLFADRLQQ